MTTKTTQTDIAAAEWKHEGVALPYQAKSVSHGVCDAKGREVGSSVHVLTRESGVWELFTNATRDGKRYGATSIYTVRGTESDAKALADAKLASARKAALKKAAK